MTALSGQLALQSFMCKQFGYPDIRTMLDCLPENLQFVFPADGESEFARSLYLGTPKIQIDQEKIAEYDLNIIKHSHRLKMTGMHGRVWKPHQYLALIFTEHYLRRYFEDVRLLCDDLNDEMAALPQTRHMPNYCIEDLHTIALQSATGSGKTLVMHANILQYQHWLGQNGGQLNHIILLTPNEQMSAQHAREMNQSNLQARIFTSESTSDLLSPVEIIDLNKLADKKGVKRVAVRDFGDNNLVLVDEGHLGASGRVWREHREELATSGFTFEYSATFNQIAGKDNILRSTYGKCLLFDYSYSDFYQDGYGKDYSILNLPKGMDDTNSNAYLLGCMLTFYQQCCFWRDKGASWADFNVTKPLWVFLGKTVTGGSRVDSATRSDVIQIIEFLGWFLARADEVIVMLGKLLSGNSGLTNEAEGDYFARKFEKLRMSNVSGLYTEMCQTIFHGQGQLSISYLTTGAGELHLRVSNNPPFGVVNVGDSATLYKLLVERKNTDFEVKREMGFVERLFPTVDREDSQVNVVIGARRFIAGWNSWRVSTMGLMHVGVGEGPEIIQMFGRGVRLKGWNMTLKRHLESDAEPPEDSEELAELETLYIFGLRSNYMQVFREILEQEGMLLETIRLPVTWNFAKRANLKMIRLKRNLQFERSDTVVSLPGPGDRDQPTVELNLYSQLQAIASRDNINSSYLEMPQRKFSPEHTAFFNSVRIYDSILAYKHQMGWHNLEIQPDVIDRLISSNMWYRLYTPSEQFSLECFEDIRRLESIFIDLVVKYAELFWRKQRQHWEHDKIEVVKLDEDDPNSISEHLLKVNSNETKLIQDIELLTKYPDSHTFHQLKLTLLQPKNHAYVPLLYAHKDCKISIQPVPLNAGEKKVVEELANLADDAKSGFQDNDIRLIRNLVRGRGVSFFDDYSYYPDFIVFMNDANRQHVIFLDPKGLVKMGPKELAKIRLHQEIKNIEDKIQQADSNLFLHAYILSVTAPDQIGTSSRSQEDWEKLGVYFLDDPNSMKKVLNHVLQSSQTH